MVHDLQFGLVDFELDSKTNVDCFYSNKINMLEFEDIFCNCRDIFYANSRVEIVKTQANKVVHKICVVIFYK